MAKVTRTLRQKMNGPSAGELARKGQLLAEKIIDLAERDQAEQFIGPAKLLRETLTDIERLVDE